MPQEYAAVVAARKDLGSDVFRLDILAPGLAASLHPGQFLQVSPGGGGYDPLLRRPFSYLTRDPEAGQISLLIRVVGRGTTLLHRVRQGDRLSVLGPLGRGFSLAAAGPVLLVAGGMGLVPLFDLAATLAKRVAVTMVYGARTAGDLHERASLGTLPLQLILATEDGSAGVRGTALAALADLALRDHAFYYACGPRPMLASLPPLMAAAGVPGELSLEERMACGFGVCLGCAVPLKGPNGTILYQRACADGPVFPAAEVILDA